MSQAVVLGRVEDSEVRSLDLLYVGAATVPEEMARLDAVVSVAVQTIAAAERVMHESSVHLLVVGPSLETEAVLELLERQVEFPENAARRAIVLTNGPVEAFADAVEAGAVKYVCGAGLSDRAQQQLAMAVLGRQLRPSPALGLKRDVESALVLRRFTSLSQSVMAERDMRDAAAAAELASVRWLEAHGATCLAYDAHSDSLYAAALGIHDKQATVTGLASFSLLTGQAVNVDDVRADPRFDPDVDDPRGLGHARFVAVPVVAASGDVCAVLTATRSQAGLPFGQDDVGRFSQLAAAIAGSMANLLLAEEADQALVRKAGSNALRQQIFRDEALQSHVEGFRPQGNVLRLASGWMRGLYWALLLVVCLAVGYLVLGSMNEYARGVAVVHARGETRLAATSGGTLTHVAAQPGQQVTHGEVLAQFYDSQEEVTARRLKQELEGVLLRYLRNPRHAETRAALASKRAELAQARSRLDERTLRAPHDGLVGDVWARPGDHVEAGAHLFSIHGDETRLSLVVALPGAFRPQLRVGMPIRFELDGYEYSAERFVINSIGHQVIGAAEAQRFLGQQALPAVGDAPVVLVEARMAEPSFNYRGQTYVYHHGMRGLAEVRLRRERLLFALIPQLRLLTEVKHD